MNTAAVPDQPIRHAPHALWLVAQHFLHILHGLFGAPEEVAADHTYVRKDYAFASLLAPLRRSHAAPFAAD